MRRCRVRHKEGEIAQLGRLASRRAPVDVEFSRVAHLGEARASTDLCRLASNDSQLTVNQ